MISAPASSNFRTSFFFRRYAPYKAWICPISTLILQCGIFLERARIAGVGDFMQSLRQSISISRRFSCIGKFLISSRSEVLQLHLSTTSSERSPSRCFNIENTGGEWYMNRCVNLSKLIALGIVNILRSVSSTGLATLLSHWLGVCLKDVREILFISRLCRMH